MNKIRQKARKLIYGVGINDSDYVTVKREFIIGEDGRKKRIIVWRCPFFATWRSMLARCYSETYLKSRPSYEGCSVCEEWLTFSNFKAWMCTQDWEGKELDKDILIRGNRVYCPNTCVFVYNDINSFVKVEEFSRGLCLPGVHIHTQDGRFCARVSVAGKVQHIGLFKSEEDAHSAWKREKYLQVIQMQNRIPEKVFQALLERYS